MRAESCTRWHLFSSNPTRPPISIKDTSYPPVPPGPLYQFRVHLSYRSYNNGSCLALFETKNRGYSCVWRWRELPVRSIAHIPVLRQTDIWEKRQQFKNLLPQRQGFVATCRSNVTHRADTYGVPIGTLFNTYDYLSMNFWYRKLCMNFWYPKSIINIHNSLWVSIIQILDIENELWIVKNELWILKITCWCFPILKMIFDIHNPFFDIHDSEFWMSIIRILDIHKWILDIET